MCSDSENGIFDVKITIALSLYEQEHQFEIINNLNDDIKKLLLSRSSIIDDIKKKDISDSSKNEALPRYLINICNITLDDIDKEISKNLEKIKLSEIYINELEQTLIIKNSICSYEMCQELVKKCKNGEFYICKNCSIRNCVKSNHCDYFVSKYIDNGLVKFKMICLKCIIW
jgi:hypothetical protein